jgi:hypothetical protein
MSRRRRPETREILRVDFQTEREFAAVRDKYLPGTSVKWTMTPPGDTGEMLLQNELAIAPDETAPELSARLAETGAELMVETLRSLVEGEIMPRAQDHAAGRGRRLYLGREPGDDVRMGR